MAGAKNPKGSKNNAALRKGAQQVMIEGKVVQPIKITNNSGSFMSAAYKDTREIILDSSSKNPILWSDVIIASKKNPTSVN